MIYTSQSIEKVTEIFASLPSIGRKTAQRLTFHLLRQPDEFVELFSNSLIDLKRNVRFCSECFNYTESDPCTICSSHKRDRSVICVVEEPNDVVVIEKTHDFFGLYHVLHGVMNPLEGITQEEIKIKELIARMDGIEEVILALNPTVEGELTTHYIAKILKHLDKKVTRIASGVPMGSALEFTDEATISRALVSRIAV
ncbi:MAG: recombination mediator RecR [Candidatus Kapabacteria bacterium]|nr:recombination mediator RecR [Ignavibacteriota bacterium]MCW5886077.1 recombination mediator RecR [Candidatus Kapabacteria bacterium]